MSRIAKIKSALRSDVRSRLSSMNRPTMVRKSAHLQTKFIESNHYRNSKHIGIYSSIEKEVDTNMIIKKAFSDNKRIYIPKIYGNGNMDLYELYESDKIGSTLVHNKWDIPEIINYESRIDPLSSGTLDVIVVPCLAVDRTCSRLGNGMGYYDRYIQRCKDTLNKPIPELVGLVFEEQLIPNVPLEDHDQSLDIIMYS